MILLLGHHHRHRRHPSSVVAVAVAVNASWWYHDTKHRYSSYSVLLCSYCNALSIVQHVVDDVRTYLFWMSSLFDIELTYDYMLLRYHEKRSFSLHFRIFQTCSNTVVSDNQSIDDDLYFVCFAFTFFLTTFHHQQLFYSTYILVNLFVIKFRS